jgi:hypothetical protein
MTMANDNELSLSLPFVEGVDHGDQITLTVNGHSETFDRETAERVIFLITHAIAACGEDAE